MAITGDTTPTYTFAIVTCPARKDMEWLHDRMPLIFGNGSYTVSSQCHAVLTSFLVDDMKLWLDPTVGWTSKIQAILEPYRGEPLTVYQGMHPHSIRPRDL